MRYWLVLFLSVLFSSVVAAQDIVVIGQVLSAEDATPLQAANVWFKGTNIGTTTNEEGFFILRSPEPQSALVVSVVGYRKKSVRLEPGKDQMVEVLLREETSILDEIVVLPRQDDAHVLLGRVRANRAHNDPANIANITTVRRRDMYANITNVKGSAFRRRLFADLESGAIAQTDTNYSLPMYGLSQTERLTILPDSTAIELSDKREDAVDLINADNWRQLLETYLPTVNPYRPYTTILGSNFLNPTAPAAKTYYNIYIADSVSTASGKTYTLSFSPKRRGGLLLRGTIGIDSATAAITDAQWRLPSYTPVNYLHNYSYSLSAAPVDSVCYFPERERQLLDLQLMTNFSKQSGSIGALLSNTYHYTGTRLLTDTVTLRQSDPLPDSVDMGSMQAVWAGIDSINQTRIRRLASWAVDIVLNQYLHIWKIDLGPLLNLYHYNRYEGSSPRLTLRSGKSFARNFTFGGYYGYGFRDKQHKYGAQVQWRFGRNRRHYLGFHYDHRVERYGYDDLFVYDENRVQDVDHLFNAWDQIRAYPTFAMRERMRLDYVYEQPGVRFGTALRAENIRGNHFMPFIQGGREVGPLTMIALKADVRLSWKQRTLDEYFHRMYLATDYPIVRFTAELGGLTVGEYSAIYGLFNLYARQSFPLGFGRFNWVLRGSAVVGTVPWPLLHMVHTSRSAYFHDTDFALLNQMELASDLYVAAHLRYQTRGYIFGYIPWVKKLGIREDVIFKIGYGRLRNAHNEVLALPSMIHSWGNMPYIEAGFGLSNILHLGDIHFLWRVTHRDAPDAVNFGVHWRFNLDF